MSSATGSGTERQGWLLRWGLSQSQRPQQGAAHDLHSVCLQVFADWLLAVDQKMKAADRHILTPLDNAASHKHTKDAQEANKVPNLPKLPPGHKGGPLRMGTWQAPLNDPKKTTMLNCIVTATNRPAATIPEQYDCAT